MVITIESIVCYHGMLLNELPHTRLDYAQPLFSCFLASLIAQLVKNPPAMLETMVRFLGQEDLLEKG